MGGTALLLRGRPTADCVYMAVIRARAEKKQQQKNQACLRLKERNEREKTCKNLLHNKSKRGKKAGKVSRPFFQCLHES